MNFPWRPMVLGCAVALLGSVVTPAFGANDTAVHFPPQYDSFLPPAVGQSYTDPVFGFSIKRVSDALNMPNNATSNFLQWVSTEYSTASPFNSNNTWLILQHQGYMGLYDGNGTYVRDLPLVVNVETEPRWSRSDPNVLYYVTDNYLMKLDVAAGTSSVVHWFGEYAAIRGRGESDISRDGDHFVFAADELDGPVTPGIPVIPGIANRYVFVYEISTDTKGPVLDTIGHSFNQLYIAPDNSVAIGWYPLVPPLAGPGRFLGLELFDRNMVFKRQLTHAIGHMHLTRDTNGDEVVVWASSGDPNPPILCNNGIVKVRLSDAHQTCLLQLDYSMAVHITAGDGNGWVFVETYDPTDPAPASPAWKPYTNEILQVKIDGTGVRRLFHHRSRQTSDYQYQPRATVSRDGTKLVFTSNYDLQAIDPPHHPYAYTDAYLVGHGLARSIWQPFFAVSTLETPYVGDFNGDGKTDIITFTRQNPQAFGDVYVALSTGTSFGPGVKWSDFFAINTSEQVVIGDFDGDGKDDIATWLADSSRQVYVARSFGTGMTDSAVWAGSIGFASSDVLAAGDVNGDRKADLVLFARTQGKVYVALSTGTGFGAPTVWHDFFAVSTNERPTVADLNGDGQADIVTFATDSPTAFGDVYVALSNGTRFGDGQNSAKWHDFFAIRPTEVVRIGDLNGDGKDDFFTFLPSPFAQCYTSLSTGTAMGPSTLWPEPVSPDPTDKTFVGDVNGDGKADIITFAQGEGKVYVSLAP